MSSHGLNDVEAYLQSKGLTPKRAGDLNVHVPCMFCQEDPSKRGRLYINTDPNAEPIGLFYCHLCGERGAINKLRKHFGDSIPRQGENPKDDRSYKTIEVLQDAAAYYHDLLADSPEAYHYLRDERGLTLETIQKHQLGWADGTLSNYLIRKKGYSKEDVQATGLVDQYGRDFLNGCITIPYHISGNVVCIRGRQQRDSKGGKYLTPPGQKARLYNADVTWNAEQILITEGEFDALVIEQMGFSAVGVPGATAWQDVWNGYFTNAKRIFIVFDNDTPGQAGAEKVARLLGPRSRIVKMPEHLPGENKNDPTEWIVNKGHSKDDFQLLLIQSKGGHLLTVHDAFEEWKEVQHMTGLKLGIEGIDHKLAPGLLPAQVMVVLAKTGTGKTIWMLNTFYRMMMVHPDMKILFVSLEQTRGEWFERARRIHRFYNPESRDESVLDYFKDNLMIIDKNRVTEEELVAAIEQFEFEWGQKPDLIGVDYLGYWARAYKGEPYERTSAAIMAMKAIAKDQRIAFITPHQVSRLVKFGEEMEADASRDSGVVEETADFMLGLWNEDDRKTVNEAGKTGRVALKIMKSRHGGKGTIAHLQFAPLSLAMVPSGESLAANAIHEHEWAQRRDDFEQAIYRHSTGDDRLTIPRADFEAWKQTLV